MAEYKKPDEVNRYEKPYEIRERTVTDINAEGRSSGKIRVVGWADEQEKEQGGDPEWGATIRYQLDYTGVRFTSITLEPTGDDILSSLWKRFPLGEIRRYLRRSFVDNPSFASAGAMRRDYGGTAASNKERQWLDEQKRRADKAADVLRTSKPKRGPGRKNDEHWRAITDVYMEEARIGGAPSLYQRMADRINKDEGMDYDDKTMKWMVERARDYDWLTRPGHGKVGGKKGTRYIEWEKEQKK